MPRFLICGLGSVGRRHLRNLLALGQEDIVLLRTGKSTLPDEGLEAFPAENDLETALERWQPDAVLVTNPTAMHLDVAIPAARAGCHLFLEKPVSHSRERIDELRAAQENGGRQVLVGFQFRYHPGLQTAKRLVETRAVGRPLSARAHWGEYLPDWHPWEDYRKSYSARADLGGGVLLTLCHPFDYLRWILGEVDWLTAEIGREGPLELDVEDTAEVLLRHAGGALSGVHLNYNQRPPRHDLEVVCTEGTITWQAASGALRWWTVAEEDWREETPPSQFERNAMFLEEMRHFIDVIEARAEPRCRLEDGVQALEIALASRESARKGARVELGLKVKE